MVPGIPGAVTSRSSAAAVTTSSIPVVSTHFSPVMSGDSGLAASTVYNALIGYVHNISSVKRNKNIYVATWGKYDAKCLVILQVKKTNPC